MPRRCGVSCCVVGAGARRYHECLPHSSGERHEQRQIGSFLRLLPEGIEARLHWEFCSYTIVTEIEAWAFERTGATQHIGQCRGHAKAILRAFLGQVEDAQARVEARPLPDDADNPVIAVFRRRYPARGAKPKPRSPSARTSAAAPQERRCANCGEKGHGLAQYKKLALRTVTGRAFCVGNRGTQLPTVPPTLRRVLYELWPAMGTPSTNWPTVSCHASKAQMITSVPLPLLSLAQRQRPLVGVFCRSSPLVK